MKSWGLPSLLRSVIAERKATGAPAGRLPSMHQRTFDRLHVEVSSFATDHRRISGLGPSDGIE